MQVEDHSLGHGDFEGRIGSGRVIVWDTGTWRSLTEGSVNKALEDGHLSFWLDGKKLRGGWTLQRTKRRREAAMAPDQASRRGRGCKAKPGQHAARIGANRTDDRRDLTRSWTRCSFKVVHVDYDQHGRTYTRHRRPDPRIAARIHAALGDARTVLNVGAGAGSYEPEDRWVLAVEPSATMRAQRPPSAAPAIDARAEALPFDDGASTLRWRA